MDGTRKAAAIKNVKSQRKGLARLILSSAVTDRYAFAETPGPGKSRSFHAGLTIVGQAHQI
jgi:hypothetical protein